MAVKVIPKVLRDKLGENGAEALASVVNDAIANSQNGFIQIVEERFSRKLAEEIGKFRAEVSESIANLRTEFKENMANMRAEFKEDMANMRTEFSKELANMRAEFNTKFAAIDTKFAAIDTKFAGIDTKFAEQKASLLRWMFIFWLTQMAAFLGIVWKVIP
ncbi:MAG: LA_3696 family protein [bacterium]